MSVPVLYEANETNFFHLGKGVLGDAIRAVVTEERNGPFYLEVDYLASGPQAQELMNNRILKVDAGHELKNQRFVIKRVTKMSEGRVKVYAEHVSYLTRELMLQPEIFLSGTASDALRQWKGALIDPNDFVVDSDITNRSETKLRVGDYQNAQEVLAGIRGSILDHWNGEYRFDNQHISLKKERGSKARTIIAYGRNLTNLEQEEAIHNTYTSVYPYAIQSETVGNGTKETLYTLPERCVDSEYRKNYPNRKTLVVDFSDKFGDKQRPTETRLRTLAKQYIKANNIGIPKVSMTVSFVDLSKALEEGQETSIEQINLCDRIPVHFPLLGIKTEAKVVRMKWNVLTDTYDELELGDIRTNFKQSMLSDLEKQVKQTRQTATVALLAANGKNTIFKGEDEPIANKLGDIWFKPDGEHSLMFIWDGSTWRKELSTRPNKEITDAIQAQQEELDKIKGSVQQTLELADKVTKEVSKQNQQLLDISGVFDRTASEYETKFDEFNGKLSTTVQKKAFDEATQKMQLNLNQTIDTSTAHAKLLAQLEKDVDGKVSETKYSQFVQRVDSLQASIGNKASKAEMTVLSNQIQTVVQSVDGMENGKPNLLMQSRYPYLGKSDLTTVFTGNYTEIGYDEANLVKVRGRDNTLVLKRRMALTTSQYYKQLLFTARLGTNEATELTIRAVYFAKDTEVGRSSQKVQFTAYDKKIITLSDHIKGDVTHVQMEIEGPLRYVLYLDWVKLESGNPIDKPVPTPWRPAHEEVVTQSKITQLSDAINLRVQKGDLLSQFNLEAGRTLIQSNKILLDAQSVTFSGKAFIPSALIKDLKVDAATIYGTLNAANVNLINMNASNLSVGYVNGDRIAANSITAKHLTADAIEVGLNSYTQSLKLTKNEVNFFENGSLVSRLDRNGYGFYSLDTFYGKMGLNHMYDNATIKGLVFDAEYDLQYFAWASKAGRNSRAYTTKMALFVQQNYKNKLGLYLDAPAYFNQGFGKEGMRRLNFEQFNQGTAIGLDASDARLNFQDDDIHYLTRKNGRWTHTAFEDIINVIRELKGLGTVCIPTSMYTDGTVSRWKTIRL